MKDKTTPALFSIVREAANKLWVGENGTAVREALNELERRTGVYSAAKERFEEVNLRGRVARLESETVRLEVVKRSEAHVLGKLARLQEDLDAFKRAHASHFHGMHGSPPSAGLNGIPVSAKVPGPEDAKNTDDPFHPYKIQDMRDNAENRAWRQIQDWIEHTRDTGMVFTVEIEPPQGCEKRWSAMLVSYKNEERTNSPMSKPGTSRLDALAHLAAWCSEDMRPLVEVKRTVRCAMYHNDDAQCVLPRNHEGRHAFKKEVANTRCAARGELDARCTLTQGHEGPHSGWINDGEDWPQKKD